MTTYDRGDWGGDATAEGVLTTNDNSVYASTFGVVEIGIPGTAGYSTEFTDALRALDCLPASGPIGSLDADLANPTSTSSGAFGGAVLAPRFNIDFSDGGYLAGSAGLAFSDLTLCNFTTLPWLDEQRSAICPGSQIRC